MEEDVSIASQHNLRVLFTTVATGDIASAKAARKDLNSMCMRTGSRDALRRACTAAFCDELISQYKTIEDPSVRARYMGALSEIYFYMHDRSKALRELVLEDILHRSATVRLAAVRMADHLRLDFFYDDRGLEDATRERRADESVICVIDLIQKHAPREWFKREESDPIVVPKLPPSIGKSLLMLWETFSNVGMYTEDFLDRHPECKLPFPVRFVDERYDDEDDDQYVNVKDLAEELWVLTPITKEAREGLLALEKGAFERLERSVASLAVDAKKIATIIKEAEQQEDTSSLQQIMVELSTAAHQQGWRPEQMHTVIRALQGYSENLILQNESAEPYSSVIVAAADNLPKAYVGRAPELPEKIFAAHQALDYIIDTFLQREEKQYHSYRFMTTVEQDEEIRKHIPRYEECRSIGHTSLDWYLKYIPEALSKKPSEQVAAIALDVMLRFNEEGPVSRWTPFHRKELSEAGGWKWGIGSTSISAYAAVRESMTTPEMLVLSADPEFDEVPLPSPTNKNPAGAQATTIGTPMEQLHPDELTMRISILFNRYDIEDRANMEDVRRWVYESENVQGATNKFQTKFIELFPADKLKRQEAYLEVMGAAVDAWNAFPHKVLGGKSPLEMIRKYKDKK